jgi:hypothetical protein
MKFARRETSKQVLTTRTFMKRQGCSWYVGRMLGAWAALLAFIAVPLILLVIVILLVFYLR